MSNIVPQPQITFENNKIYVDSPVDVKYTLDGLDPVFYGVIYTSPISISHTTTIKAISVNSLGEISNLVAGTFTPESDVSDGSSNSSWIPVTYTYILNPSPGGGADLSNYTTYSYINSYYTSYSYINANYTTFSYLEDKNYATEQYVDDAIDNIEFPEPDLSSYITSDELAQELSSYVTKDELSAQSYLTSIPSEYITQTELSNCGYITASDIPSVVVPVIDESIIPNTTATYTLGDSSHIYSNTYSRGVYLGTGVRIFSESSASSNDMAISLGGVSYFYLNSNRFSPNGAANNEKLDLGTSDRKWNRIYGKSVNVDTAYLQDTSYTKSIVPAETAAYTLGDANHFYARTYTGTIQSTSGGLIFRVGNSNTVTIGGGDMRPNTDGAQSLGRSSNHWNNGYINNIYTENLYADTIHNFIWTGTSAEYAALDNYTSYQIYMIKES